MAFKNTLSHTLNMSFKGMSFALQIVIVIVVLLVVAFVVLGVFAQGTTGAQNTILGWLSEVSRPISQFLNIGGGGGLPATCPSTASNCKPLTQCAIANQGGNAQNCLQPNICCSA